MAAANSGNPACGIDGGRRAAPPQVRGAQRLPHLLWKPPTASTGRYAPSRLVSRLMMAFTPGHSLSESEEGRGHVRVARRVPATRGSGGSSPGTGSSSQSPKVSGFHSSSLERLKCIGVVFASLRTCK